MSSPKAAHAKPLRKRSASPRPARGEHSQAQSLAARASQLAREVETAVAAGRHNELPPECVQSLMSAACRAYAAQDEAGIKYPPLAEQGPTTATDVMIATSGLLKAAGLQVFELGMWVSYTGR